MCVAWLPPLRSPPHYRHYAATRRSGSLNFINLIFLLQGTCLVSMEPTRWVTYSLPCLPTKVIPSTCHCHFPRPRNQVSVWRSARHLVEHRKTMAPEEGDRWPHESMGHVGIRDVTPWGLHDVARFWSTPLCGEWANSSSHDTPKNRWTPKGLCYPVIHEAAMKSFGFCQAT